MSKQRPERSFKEKTDKLIYPEGIPKEFLALINSLLR